MMLVSSTTIIIVRNRLSELEQAGRAVEAFGATHRLAKKLIFECVLAIDEVLTNVISYGFDDTDDHEILVHLAVEADTVTIQVEDDARPFDPLQALPPDLDTPIEKRPVGGLGLHLVRTVMDGLEYHRQQDRNVLVMRKAIVTG